MTNANIKQATSGHVELVAEPIATIFLVFARRLSLRLQELQAASTKPLRVCFVGRDGFFLFELMCLWRQYDPGLACMTFHYEEINRRTARLACVRVPGDLKSLCHELRYTKTINMTGPALAEYFNLPRTWIAAEESVQKAVELLAGPFFSQVRDRAATAAKYLEAIVASSDCFVDIGWQGTMSILLDQAVPAYHHRPWLFLAQWSDRLKTPLRPVNTGLLVDSFRRKTLLDKSLWDLFSFFEAFCKGSIINGNSKYHFPQLNSLRDRVLSLVQDSAPNYISTKVADDNAMVDRALRNAFQLANYPSPSFFFFMDSISCDFGIDDWTEPTSPVSPINPIFHPKRWLLGFSCPWKGGWAFRSAGRFGAWFWICMNYLLMRLGPWFTDFSRLIVSPSQMKSK